MIGQENLLKDTLFNRTIESLKENKTLREAGKHITIPFGFPRLNKLHPGISKGTINLISANTKIGKSQITDALYLYNPVNFVLTQNTNIKVKIFSFNLEMSKESKMRQVIAYRLYKKHQIRLAPRKLQSLYEDYILSDDILRFIDEDREWFESFENIVTFTDSVRNPTGIMKMMTDYARNNGKYYNKHNEIIPMDKILLNDEEVNKTIDRYEQNDPDEYRIIITDHLGIMQCEKNQGVTMNLYDTISKWSSDYCIRLRNRFGYIMANVQQQAAGNEGVDALKVDRQEPSANNLSDNKSTAKDCDMLITLHSPFRAKQRAYMGYNIEKLKDNYRHLKIEFDRNGSGCETPLFFDGSVNFFSELPLPEQMTPALYDEITKRQ